MFFLQKYVLLVTVKTPIAVKLYFNNYQTKWEKRKIVNETTVVKVKVARNRPDRPDGGYMYSYLLLNSVLERGG
jgi:hypothetical protein